MGAGHAGLNFQRLPEMADGRVIFPAGVLELGQIATSHGIPRRALQAHGSTRPRCRANRRFASRPTPSATPPPLPRPSRRPNGDGPTRPTGRTPPRRSQVKADLGQIGVAIGHGLPAHLHQPDHRHQHAQVPEPADRQVRVLPSPRYGGRRYRRQQQQAPAASPTSNALPDGYG